MKLGLGTAQFGLDYGISNHRGQVPRREVDRILACAESAGVDLLDTACLYGDSEAVIGQTLGSRSSFRIVTKTPQFKTQNVGAAQAAALRAAFDASLQHLTRQSVYGLLVHNADDLLVAGSEALYEAMLLLRETGQVQKIGVSVYDGRQIDAILERYSPDIVQLPINALDQRLVKSGRLSALKARGIEIHARSVLLQGLLLMSAGRLSEYFAPYRDHLQRYFRALEEIGLSPLQGALAFLNTVGEVDVAIVGVTSATELQQVVEARLAPATPRDFFESFGVTDESLINPARWPVGARETLTPSRHA